MGTDRFLEAARQGWGVTIRYAVLTTVRRWPPLVCGTGAATLAAGYARTRGWI
ncbi:hypothetical protein AB0D14_44030 [Streptomyces sp. NPDC048484]|uniref:hypothetical protein n=1 Tax=Streptomyces sp. NPDC048484 TaxID=3155146 RepID=UPI00344695E8